MNRFAIGITTFLLFACAGGRNERTRTEAAEGAAAAMIRPPKNEASVPPNIVIDGAALPLLDESVSTHEAASLNVVPPSAETPTDPCVRRDPLPWSNSWTENLGGYCKDVSQSFDGERISTCTFAYSAASLYYLRAYGTGYGRGGSRCSSTRLWETRIDGIEGAEVIRKQWLKQPRNLFDDCQQSCKTFDGTLHLRLLIAANGRVLKVSATGTDHREISDCVEATVREMTFPSPSVQTTELEVRFISRTYEEAAAKAGVRTPPEPEPNEPDACRRIKDPPPERAPEPIDFSGHLETAGQGTGGSGRGEGIGLGCITCEESGGTQALSPNGPNAAEIKKALKPRQGKIRECFKKASLESKTVRPMRITVYFRVSPSGEAVDVSSHDLLKPSTRQCFENIVKETKFRSFKGGTSLVSYTFKIDDL